MFQAVSLHLAHPVLVPSLAICRLRCARRGPGVQSHLVTDTKKATVLTEISLILAAVFWGTNYAATKYAAEFVPPLLIVAIRFTVGGVLMLCLLRILESGDKLTPKDLLPVVGLGCLGVAIGQTAFTFGVSLTSAANTGLIFATAPVWGLLLGSMPVLERHSPLAVATYSLLFGGLVVMLLSSPYLISLDWSSVGLGAWAAVGFSAIFATAFAFSAWQTGISRIGANRVLVYQYLITVTGVASG